jgi:hypothetical protein
LVGFGLALFNLSFFEQDTPSYNRIKLDETDLVRCSADVFACCVEKSRPCGTGQLDGNGLAAAAGHLECRCGKHVVSSILFTEDFTIVRRNANLQVLWAIESVHSKGR